MNILILCTHLNPGGISRYVINLADGLAKRGNRVWVSCAGGLWLDELAAKNIGFLKIPINTKSIASPKVFLSLSIIIRFARKEKVQIIHGNTRVTQLLGFLVALLLRIPCASTFHGFHKTTPLRKLLKFSGTKTIAVSHAVKEHLIRDFGIKSDNVVVVYNGIDIVSGMPEAHQRSKLGFSDDDLLIGILGRISEEKGHVLAAHALRHFFDEHRRAYFMISGTGRVEEELKNFFSEQKISDRVRFLTLESKSFLSLIDILLVPSRKEGFGFAIIEAFLAGVPVIGFNTGGISEIIKDRENGVLFYEYEPQALRAALETLVSDEKLRKRIINNAKSEVVKYSLQRMAGETEAVFKEIAR